MKKTALSGNGLNSYCVSKLSDSDVFQQSILKSPYRSLKEKRDIICQDYGTLLEECNRGKLEVEKRKIGILFGTYSKSTWEDGSDLKWYKSDNKNRDVRYKGEVENGKPNDQGTYSWSDGEKYVGEFKDGRYDGQGTYTSPVGDKY